MMLSRWPASDLNNLSTSLRLPTNNDGPSHERLGLDLLSHFTRGYSRQLSGTEDGQLTLWDVKSAAPLGTVRPTKKPILRAAVSPLRDCVSIITPEALRCVPLTTDGRFQVRAAESDVSKWNTFVGRESCSARLMTLLRRLSRNQGHLDPALPLSPHGVLYFQAISTCSTMAPRPMLDCVWNSKTGELYSTAADGAIAVFRDQPCY